MNNINWDKLQFTSKYCEGSGMDYDRTEYYLSYGNKSIYLNRENSPVSEEEVAELLGIKCDKKFRAALWENNKEVFWRTQMHPELRELAMSISEKQLAELEQLKTQAHKYITEYETLATKLYGKEVRFSRYY